MYFQCHLLPPAACAGCLRSFRVHRKKLWKRIDLGELQKSPRRRRGVKCPLILSKKVESGGNSPKNTGIFQEKWIFF